ncbi:CAX-interacting protein 4-like [Diospyros lotus]|uniref:CAX-interacting protein 4-like n=1 Tax=Diospyros lotus TaxID=55363 RepID=UPI00225A7BBC|nr:CAX-interacting protein 4-like [Diospyros lotus]XP_052169915.1 CAX-interacting protein 4-like [Diospyros lotus]
MPATAGRVRMPANNRVHSSAALQTHSIWQTAIGYDPYAPNNVEGSNKNAQDRSSNMGMEAVNAYASFQGLLALARKTGSNANEARGACKKCGRVGHLTFQCRNFLSTVKDDIKEKDPDAFEAAILSGLDKVKGNCGEAKGGRNAFERLEEKSSEEEEEKDSESSDSDCDSEIERAIAEKNGNNVRSKLQYLRQKKEDFDEYNLVYGHKKKKGRSNKRSGKKERTDTDTDNEDKERSKRRKETRRRKDESPDEDVQCRHVRRKSQKEKRKGSQRRSDDLVSEDSECFTRRHKRKGRRAASPSFSDISSSEDSSVGRQKEVRKKMRRHHCEDDDD